MPVETPALQERLRTLLAACLEDNRQAWDLGADGRWIQRRPQGSEVRSTHVRLLTDSWGRSPDAVRSEAGPFNELSTRQSSAD